MTQPLNPASAAAAREALEHLSAVLVAETGWKRCNGHTLLWIGEPHPNWEGRDVRDVLRLQGRGEDLAILTTELDPSTDPADLQEVMEELDDGYGSHESVLPLGALYSLRDGVNMAITAMEAAEVRKVASLASQQPAGPALSLVKP